MKKLSISGFFLIFGVIITFGQGYSGRDNKRQPPQAVQRSFHNDQPDVNDVNWQRGNNHWRASHRDPSSKRHVDTYYDDGGQRVDTHRELDRRDVPQEVDRNMRNRYHANGNYSATRIERPDQTAVFQLSIHSGRRKKPVYMDDQGNEIRYNDRH